MDTYLRKHLLISVIRIKVIVIPDSDIIAAQTCCEGVALENAQTTERLTEDHV